MSWAATPPEVISGQIYAGSSAPLYAAAAALTNLATELGTVAAGWQTQITDLTALSGWTGTGATSAAAAAQTYITWLLTTEAEVTQAAAQATASAAAFDAVRAAVVNPALIAANKAAQITDALTLNLPQLAADEAVYQAYWATDVAAMGAYQAASLAAGVLPAPVSVTGAINPISTSAAPAAAAATGLSLGSGDLITSIDGLIGTPFLFNGFNTVDVTASWMVMNAIPTAVSLGHTLAGAAVPAAAVGDVTSADGAGVVEGTMVRSVTPGGIGPLAGGIASAGVGEATTVGKLSVPASWAATTQAEASLASSAAPLEGSGWTVAEEAGTAVGAPGMPGMVAGAKGAGAYAGPRYGVKPIVMPKQVVV